MKILLANPPWIKRNENRYGVRAGSRWPFTLKLTKDNKRHYLPFPFFLAYAASLLKKNKNDVTLIDAVAQGMDEHAFIEKLKVISPQLVVMETSTPSFKNDINLAGKIKRDLKNIKIALCSLHATTFPKEILEQYRFIDYVLIGEYEETLLDLVVHLDQGIDLRGVLGLGYRESADIKVNEKRSTIKNLDNLPWPERKSLPIYLYNDGFCDLPKPNVQMLASRGCPYKCTFCAWPQVIYQESVYRKRNPVRVIDEMEWLLKEYGFKAVYFDDDTFNVDKKYVDEICREMNRRKIKVPWAIMARPDLMDEGILQKLSASGCYAIKYGIESPDANILTLSGKDMDISLSRKMIEFTKTLGIKVHLTFCLGLPGETRHTIQETVRFIEEIAPDSFQISFATPFPGTEYFNRLKERALLTSDSWEDFDGGRKCIIRTEELTREDLERIKLDLDSYFKLQ